MIPQPPRQLLTAQKNAPRYTTTAFMACPVCGDPYDNQETVPPDTAVEGVLPEVRRIAEAVGELEVYGPACDCYLYNDEEDHDL